MSEIINEILNKLPKWIFPTAFIVLIVFMAISLVSGTTFKVGGLEFGFSSKEKTPDSNPVFYNIIGMVVTSDGQPSNEIFISSRYPPVRPSSEGTIVGLEVWKNPLGKFPILYFSHEAYLPRALDLNDSDMVSISSDGSGHKITIKKSIIMLTKKNVGGN